MVTVACGNERHGAAANGRWGGSLHSHLASWRSPMSTDPADTESCTFVAASAAGERGSGAPGNGRGPLSIHTAPALRRLQQLLLGGFAYAPALCAASSEANVVSTLEIETIRTNGHRSTTVHIPSATAQHSCDLAHMSFLSLSSFRHFC